MSTWFRSTSESERLLAEERVVLGATELLAEAMEHRGLSQQDLAHQLNVSPSEISQRMSGRRNLSLRKFGEMLHVLGFGLEARLIDHRSHLLGAVRVDAEVACAPSASPVSYTRTGVPLIAVSSRRAS